MERLNTPFEIEQLFNKILDKIKPSPIEIKKIQDTVDYLRKIILESQIPPEIQIDFIEAQGSTGIKQTSIKNAADIDLFIGLDPESIFSQNLNSKTKRRKFIKSNFKNYILNWLIPALKNKGIDEIEISYAEHPYISAKWQGFELDVVICFNIDEGYLFREGPITAVDRSPHHSRFIMKNLSESQKDEVRLLKQFFKAQHCYGDKSPVGRSGFMGYVAELLIAYFGNLWTVLNNFETLEQEFISFFDFMPFKKQDALAQYKDLKVMEIRKKFFPTDYLIIIDPTDFNRNVGSSISSITYHYIKEIIKEFLNKPDDSYFNRKEIRRIDEMNLEKKTLGKYYYVEYEMIEEDHYTKFRDKLYSLMQKVTESAQREFSGVPRFIKVASELYFKADKGKYCMAFHTSTPSISQEYLRKGPKMDSQEHVKKFKRKHPEAIEKDGYLHVIETRKYTLFQKYLEQKLRKENIKRLSLQEIGCAIDSQYEEGIVLSKISAQTMGILHDILNRTNMLEII